MLDLSSNKIKHLLPLNSQGKYRNALESIQSLNLSDNPLKCVKTTAEILQSLMPGLTDLQISLFEESDVDTLISHLPSLQYLNNLAVERSEL